MTSASASDAKSVAVWEYVKYAGVWKPYPPDACRLFEKARSASEAIVPIQNMIPDTRPHSVDVIQMLQVFNDVNDLCTTSPVRRLLYPLDSAPAKGISWQWQSNSGSKFHTYSMNHANLIEKVLAKGIMKINLQDYFPDCIYTVDLTNMVQINNFTGFRRTVRKVTGEAYPVAFDSVTCPGFQVETTKSRKLRMGKSLGKRSKCHKDTATAVANANAGNALQNSKVKRPIDSMSDSTSDAELLSNASASPETLEGEDAPEALGTLEFLSKHTEDVPEVLTEDCSICFEQLSSTKEGDGQVVRLKQCSHYFHLSCLSAMYESSKKAGYLQCPNCKAIYGVKRGDQPAGTMSSMVLPFSLGGYEGCGTIQVTYHIPPGIQGPEHPHPGRRYSARGFPRHGYLPDNEVGRKALKLLTEAWERRLIFTIGESITTGEENTVTWNEIHHKTEYGGNYTGHGYPDPLYLDHLFMELKAQGVGE